MLTDHRSPATKDRNMKKILQGFGKYLAAVIAVLFLCIVYPLWNGAGPDGSADSRADVQQSSRNSGHDADVGQGNDDEGRSEEEGLYTFRREEYLTEHFEKHGAEFNYATKEEYEAGANRVIASEDALYKTEAEDGDHIYYLEATNEIVFVSTDGYIRTYFRPRDGIEYFNRQ